MNINDDFYVTLTSNSSLDIYPGNKTSNFRVQLVKELYLENYRVALTEIIYPNKFKNVTDDNSAISFGYSFTRNVDGVSVTENVLERCEIPTGNYKTIDDLTKEINKAVIKKSDKKVDMLRVDGDDNKVKITAEFKKSLINTAETLKLIRFYEKTFDFLIMFENRLARQLGFLPNVNVFEHKSFNYSINEGYPHEIFLYSNILDYQIISNSYAPLLKIVPVNANMKKNEGFGEKVRIEFINRNYLNLCQNNIKTIAIECRDSQSRPIAFEDGNNIILTLHFIKQN